MNTRCSLVYFLNFKFSRLSVYSAVALICGPDILSIPHWNGWDGLGYLRTRHKFPSLFVSPFAVSQKIDKISNKYQKHVHKYFLTRKKLVDLY